MCWLKIFMQQLLSQEFQKRIKSPSIGIFHCFLIKWSLFEILTTLLFFCQALQILNARYIKSHNVRIFSFFCQVLFFLPSPQHLLSWISQHRHSFHRVLLLFQPYGFCNLPCITNRTHICIYYKSCACTPNFSQSMFSILGISWYSLWPRVLSYRKLLHFLSAFAKTNLSSSILKGCEHLYRT